MERFESKVIRVSPSKESIRIEEMAIFGWSLQSRQDVVKPVGASSTITEGEVETDIHSTHHVALHFVRPLSLPHLEELKQLEFEYFHSSPPSPPRGAEGGGCLCLLFGLGCVISGIALLIEGDGWEKLWGLLIPFGVFFLRLSGESKEEKDEYERRRSEWLKKQEELKQRARSLLPPQ